MKTKVVIMMMKAMMIRTVAHCKQKAVSKIF